MQNQNPRLDRSPFYCEENVEVRSLDGAGMNDSGRLVVRGYAALFNTRSREMKSFKGRRFVEEIAPGAFDNADFKDTECRFQHTRFLAAPPTLRMGVDARGLWYEYDHDPEDPDHVSVLRKIQRGDAKGSSFMFDEPEDADQEVWREGSLMVRRMKRLRKIWDVGPVVRPAYRETGVTASMRSIDAVADLEGLPGEGAETEARDMSGAYEANTNPTPAQKEAGNYKKGKVRVHGMEISIENPKGSMRSGVSGDGTAWERQMHAHYGYILGSKAIDGDNLDVFLTDDAESARVAFVVDQITADGNFDEHKVVIGPVTEAEARALYLSHYPADWPGFGSICGVPMECFRAWALDGKPKRTPLVWDGVTGSAVDAAVREMEGGGTSTEAGGTVVESGGNPVEQSGTAAESGGIPVEKNGTVEESGGSPAEVGGTAAEESGTAEESGGTPVEVARSADGSPAEAGGTETEDARSAAERIAIIERRRLQVRATLI